MSNNQSIDKEVYTTADFNETTTFTNSSAHSVDTTNNSNDENNIKPVDVCKNCISKQQELLSTQVAYEVKIESCDNKIELEQTKCELKITEVNKVLDKKEKDYEELKEKYEKQKEKLKNQTLTFTMSEGTFVCLVLGLILLYLVFMFLVFSIDGEVFEKPSTIEWIVFGAITFFMATCICLQKSLLKIIQTIKS